MYLIDKEKNRISGIKQKTFSELGFRERENLQEWIANFPLALDEDLLIIQKEFSGFNDTNERLDLLALDKKKCLVIIENKLDDSGKDVTWQSLKYASYCSSLKKEQIRDIYQSYLDKYEDGVLAQERLQEFYNCSFDDLQLNVGISQRIILVAGNFKKEVTSTVLWLMNFGLRIQCFKVTPYELDERLILDIEQIIPIKDAEEYIISMQDKNLEDQKGKLESDDRSKIRLELWKRLLDKLNQKTSLFKNISPSKDPWMNAASGIGGIVYSITINKDSCRVEVYISRSTQEESKKVFDRLIAYKDEIEGVFGKGLEWYRLENRIASKVTYSNTGLNSYDKEQWDLIVDFLADGVYRLEKAFQSHILALSIPVNDN